MAGNAEAGGEALREHRFASARSADDDYPAPHDTDDPLFRMAENSAML
jgi:hypothetical protein